MKESVGVDLGGTWARVCALDRRGGTLFDVRRPSGPPLASTLKSLWKKHGLEPRRLVVGAKGVWKKTPRLEMARSLKGLAERVVVLSDVELAYLSVLGHRPGVLLLAGTGSIALARDRDGRWHRAGGLGPAKGDEGSGYWIGREYRRRALGKNSATTADGVRKTAALVPGVLRRQERDPLCREILEQAARHLSRIARSAAEKAGLKRPVIGWYGGLMERENFRRKVLERLKAGKIFPPKLAAARFAALHDA